MNKKLPFFFLLSLACAAGLHSTAIGQSDADRFMDENAKPAEINHSKLSADISESMEYIEPLALQMKNASQAEKDEILASGKQDFSLSGSNVSDVMDSVNDLLKAYASEAAFSSDQAALKGLAVGSPEREKMLSISAKDQADAADWRQKARSEIKGMHRYAKDDFLRNLHNWLMVSAGTLRQDKLVTPTPTFTPTPVSKS